MSEESVKYWKRLNRTATPGEIKEALKNESTKTKKNMIVNTQSKERRYENTLHYILGVIDGKGGLDVDDIALIQSKITEVLNEEEPTKQVIRG